MTELKKRISNVAVGGKVKVTDKSFELDKVSSGGYNYSRMGLSINIEDGVSVFGTLMGGFSTNKKNTVYSFSKASEKMEIDWADRKIEKIVENVAEFSLYKAGLEREENGDLIIKKFMSAYDFIEYVNEHLEDGSEVIVRGGFAFQEYNDEDQRSFEVQSIMLQRTPKEGEDYKHFANFTQTILLDEYSFKKITTTDAKAGQVVIQAKAIDYMSKRKGKVFKKMVPFSLPIVVKINKENADATKKILDVLFKVKKGVVREMTIEGTILEGYDKAQVSDKDMELSPEVKELIELGLYTNEEAKEKLTVKGSKVSELIFTKPFIQKDKDNANKVIFDLDDSKYTPQDLARPFQEDLEEDSIDMNEDDTKTDSGADWMKELGL